MVCRTFVNYAHAVSSIRHPWSHCLCMVALAPCLPVPGHVQRISAKSQTARPVRHAFPGPLYNDVNAANSREGAESKAEAAVFGAWGALFRLACICSCFKQARCRAIQGGDSSNSGLCTDVESKS